MNRPTMFIGHVLLAACLLVASAAPGKIIYVDDDATGANDGSSWANAYRYLQDALADARAADKPVEIRIGQGLYRPNEYETGDPFEDHPRGTPEPRQAKFVAMGGMTISGGYAGTGAPDPNAQDATLHQTILSGDLMDNDVEVSDPCDLPAHASRQDNCQGVLACRRGTSPMGVTLNGLLITGATRIALELSEGNVSNCTITNNSGELGNVGSGSYGGDLRFSRCTFARNWARHGGAIDLFWVSNLTLEDCLFIGNQAQETGGALGVGQNTPVLMKNCVFRENRAGTDGGAFLSSRNNEIQMRDCAFQGNVAGLDGGALCIYFSHGHITNCVFQDNRAGRDGGAVWANRPWDDLPVITACSFLRNQAIHGGAVAAWDVAVDRCWFFKNSAKTSGGAISAAGVAAVAGSSLVGNSAGDGGAMAVNTSGVTVRNTILAANHACGLGGAIVSTAPIAVAGCTFSDNSAPQGSAAAYTPDASVEAGSRFTITNCILRDGGDEIANNGAARLDVMFSDVQGSWPGAGNIDIDPCFVALGRWDPNGTPDDPNDDTWVEGDYHLKSEAGRWDPNRQSWVQDAVTSLCIDAGDPYSSYARELWPHGLRANMGAYGNTAEASMSKLPSGSIADLDQDALVRLRDFRQLAQRWLSQAPLMAEDLNRDGSVDHNDLQILAHEWLSEPVQLRFRDYWPFGLSNGWIDVYPESEGGHSVEFVARFDIKGFDIWEIEWGWGGLHGGGSSRSYYVYVNGGLYRTYSRANLDRLPDVSTGCTLEWPEVIQPGQPLRPGKGMLVPIRTTLRQLASQFPADRWRPLLTVYPVQDHDRDVLAFVDASGKTLYAFGRNYGPILVNGDFMRRSGGSSK